jgi:hypothetical protein
MNTAKQRGVKRRPFMIGLLGLLGLGAVTGLALEVPRILSVRPDGPYEELLAAFHDLNAPIVVGNASLTRMPRFEPGEAASRLRKRMGRKPLSQTMRDDASENRMTEVAGWVLPEALVTVCALAAVDG